MIKIDLTLKPSDLSAKLKRFWQLSGEKIHLIENSYDVSKGHRFLQARGSIWPGAGQNGRRDFYMGP